MSSFDALLVRTIQQLVISVQYEVNVLFSQTDDCPVVHDDVGEQSVGLGVGIVHLSLAPLECRHEEATKDHQRGEDYSDQTDLPGEVETHAAGN